MYERRGAASNPPTPGLGADTRPYDLRHSFLSLLLLEGATVVEVARQAGHSPTMTLSTYAHHFEELEGKAEDEIRRARETARGSRTRFVPPTSSKATAPGAQTPANPKKPTPGLEPTPSLPAATLFKALADPARVKIVNMLATRDEPVCAGECHPALSLSQATASHHLKELTDAGLLERKQQDEPGPVTREAYSHEVISFGFRRGDQKLRMPAFYSYTASAPAGLAEQPLRPEAATWQQPSGSSHFAFLAYEEVRSSPDPRATLLDFLESTHQAGAALAGWNRDALRSTWCPPATVSDNLLEGGA